MLRVRPMTTPATMTQYRVRAQRPSYEATGTRARRGHAYAYGHRVRKSMDGFNAVVYSQTEEEEQAVLALQKALQAAGQDVDVSGNVDALTADAVSKVLGKPYTEEQIFANISAVTAAVKKKKGGTPWGLILAGSAAVIAAAWLMR